MKVQRQFEQVHLLQDVLNRINSCFSKKITFASLHNCYLYYL